MATQDIGDRPVGNELGYALRAGQTRTLVGDQQPAGKEEVAGEEQARLPVVVGELGRLVAGRWQHVHDTLAEIDLCRAFRPLAEAKMTLHVCERRTDDLGVGVTGELIIA